MRPRRSTPVASTITRPAPEKPSEARCWICQSVADPSSALYWHMGETTIRFGSSMEPSWIGRKRWLGIVTSSRKVAEAADLAPWSPSAILNIERALTRAGIKRRLPQCNYGRLKAFPIAAVAMRRKGASATWVASGDNQRETTHARHSENLGLLNSRNVLGRLHLWRRLWPSSRRRLRVWLWRWLRRRLSLPPLRLLIR